MASPEHASEDYFAKVVQTKIIKFFDEINKKEAPSQESDDPIQLSLTTASVEDACSPTGGKMPTWSESTITGFINIKLSS